MYQELGRFAVLLSLPVALWLYFGLVVGGGQRLGYDYEDKHGPVLYLAFVAAVVWTVLLTVPVRVAVELSPLVTIAAPVGGALYALDRKLVSLRYGGATTASAPGFPWILSVFVGPVLEEYLYRAWLHPMATDLDPLLYLLASAVAFGLIHFYDGRHEIGLKAFDGIVYAGAYLFTGNFAVPVVLHLGYNAAYVWAASRD